MQYDQTPLLFSQKAVFSVKYPLKNFPFSLFLLSREIFFSKRNCHIFQPYIRPRSASSSFPSAFFSMRDT